MEELTRLLHAARTVHPWAHVHFVPAVEPAGGHERWIVRVLVGQAIFAESVPSEPKDAMADVTRRLEAMSQRMMKALREAPPLPEDA